MTKTEITRVAVMFIPFLLGTAWTIAAALATDKGDKNHALTRASVFFAALFVIIFINCTHP